MEQVLRRSGLEDSSVLCGSSPDCHHDRLLVWQADEESMQKDSGGGTTNEAGV